VLLDDLSQRLEASGSIARWIEMFVLKALALDILGQATKALETLEDALRLAESEGFVRTFVDEGHLMATLLRKARAGGNSSPYMAKLLAAFHQEVPAESTAQSQQPHLGDFEHLSERELEVLRLIADGASNRDIAEALVVSLGTVKKHLNNIFLKLDAHSRTQVIAIARKHNLL
jgi:LuxR family maltose regulon positive regulatory protein